MTDLGEVLPVFVPESGAGRGTRGPVGQRESLGRCVSSLGSSGHRRSRAAIGLFLFGMVLNYCVVKTGSLYPSIGLYAGCVVFLRVVGLFVTFGRTNVLLWSTKKVYEGAMGWAFLLLIAGSMTRLLQKAEPPA